MEQEAIGKVDSGLQIELAKIGQDLSSLGRVIVPATSTPPGRSSIRHNNTPPTNTTTNNNNNNHAHHRNSSNAIKTVSERLKVLQSQHSQQMQSIQNRYAEMQRLLDGNLLNLQVKAKKMEELYREARAENTLLYERFNLELSLIGQSLPILADPTKHDHDHHVTTPDDEVVVAGGGQGASAGAGIKDSSAEKVLIVSLGRANDELIKIKKENSKLKRELLQLRTSSTSSALSNPTFGPGDPSTTTTAAAAAAAAAVTTTTNTTTR